MERKTIFLINSGTRKRKKKVVKTDKLINIKERETKEK